MIFIKNYIRFDSAAINRKFEEEVHKLTNKTTNMGIEELVIDLAEKRGEIRGEQIGEASGETRNQEKVVRNMITKLGLTDAQIVAATEASINYIKKIRASIKQ